MQVQETKQTAKLGAFRTNKTLKNVIVHMILKNYQMSTAREITNIFPMGVLKKK